MAQERLAYPRWILQAWRTSVFCLIAYAYVILRPYHTGAPQIMTTHFDLTLEAICNQPHETALLQRWAKAQRGLILISGLEGSGKTTTAYALMRQALKKNRKIFTIENKEHRRINGVTHLAVDLENKDACLNAFKKTLEGQMDVLFVGGNPALWAPAVKAAKGHHLVLVQMEAASAMHALHEFRQATGPAAEDTLVGVVWQELVEDKRTQKRKANYEFIEGALGS